MGENILNWYKKINAGLRVILVPIAILGCVLWLIGNLAQWKTLVMFIFGLIVGCVLFYFLGQPLIEWINSFTIVRV